MRKLSSKNRPHHYLRFADNTRITLSQTLSGDPVGDGRSSPDRLFFSYPLDDYPARLAKGWRFAVLVMLSPLSEDALREAPRSPLLRWTVRPPRGISRLPPRNFYFER